MAQALGEVSNPAMEQPKAPGAFGVVLVESLPGAPLMQNPGTEPDLTEIWVVALLGVGSSKQQPEALWGQGSLSFSCLATALKGPGGIWGIHTLAEEPWTRLTGWPALIWGAEQTHLYLPPTPLPPAVPLGEDGCDGETEAQKLGGQAPGTPCHPQNW